jgi:coenzyme F420-reducing hydrogenase delta subunit
MTKEFEPKIVAFVCNYCTYAGADLAGTSRRKYAPNVRIIKLPCTGRISPMFILKALQKGADGVLVSGCHPGDCHFTSGNFHARRRWTVFRSLLNFAGIPDERIRVTWISAAEGNKFADTINDFTAELKKLGPFSGYQEMVEQIESPAEI